MTTVRICYLISWLHFFISSITKPALRLLAFLPPISIIVFYWSLFHMNCSTHSNTFFLTNLYAEHFHWLEKISNKLLVNYNYNSCMLFARLILLVFSIYIATRLFLTRYYVVFIDDWNKYFLCVFFSDRKLEFFNNLYLIQERLKLF